MPTVGWFFSTYFGQHQIRDTNAFELPSFYAILTKLGDITNRLTRSVSRMQKISKFATEVNINVLEKLHLHEDPRILCS